MQQIFTTLSLRSGKALSRCNRLLVLLCLLIATQPLATGKIERFLFGMFFVLILAQSAVALSEFKGHRHIVRALAVLSGLAVVATFAAPEATRDVMPAMTILLAAYTAYTAFLLLKFVMQGDADVRTRLSGAISVYLLAGVAWAMAFLTLHLLDRDSFTGSSIEHLLQVEQETGQPQGVFRFFLYYSFVTLTTLGYGDATQPTEAARTMAVMEAIGGVFYIAVIVASLIGREHGVLDEDPP